MQEEIIEYTYEQLVQIGKESNYANYDRYIKYDGEVGNTELPILRDGVIVWTKTYTPEEYNSYINMEMGIYWLHHQHLNGTDHESYLLTHPENKTLSMIGASEIITQSNAKTGSDESMRQKACEVWRLPRHVNMSSIASLFYLLYTKHMRGDAAATIELNYFLDKWAPIIANYVDMVAGGEARHMITGKGGTYKLGMAEKEIEDEAINSGLVYVDGATKMLNLKHPYAKHTNFVSTHIAGKSRSNVWFNWKEIRDTCGVIALDWCIMAHIATTSHGFGGVLWANCANLVRKRELKKVSNIFFVDQAFSLHHNNGNVFNKLWDVTNLQTVLNEAFQGKVEHLPKYLKEEEQAIYIRVCKGVSDVEVKQRSGTVNSTVREFHTHKASAVLRLKPEEELEITKV